MRDSSKYKLKIKEIIDEAPNVKTFRMDLEGKAIDFMPGQYFMISLEDDKTRKPYSIASSPTDKEYIEITFNLVGEFTKKLFQLKEGNSLILEGPYGRMVFEEDSGKNIVLIAGGLGVVPLRSMIRYCKGKKLDNQITLIYSSKNEEDFIFRKEIEASGIEFISRITSDKGRIDRELLKKYAGEDKVFYICGSLNFC